MRHTRFLKRTLTLLLSSALLLALCACGQGGGTSSAASGSLSGSSPNGQSPSSAAPADTAPASAPPSGAGTSAPPSSANISPAVQQAYLQILTANQAGIEGCEKTFDFDNNVAIADICGDSTPELILVTDPDPNYDGLHSADLCLYSMIDGQAVQVLKETYILDQEAGSDFALVKLSGGGFYVIRSQSGQQPMDWNESVSQYTLAGGQLSAAYTLSYAVEPLDFSSHTHTDTCEENGNAIGLASYQSKCADLVNSIQDVLICYGYTEVRGGDIDNFVGIGTVLNAKVASASPLAVTCGEAASYLGGQL